MPERPILFSDRMVRAILGDRKTQTRRVVTPMPGRQKEWLTLEDITKSPRLSIARLRPEDGGHFGATIEHPLGGPLGWVRCPYGEPGSLLWLKESWAPVERDSDSVDGIRYQADDAFVPIANTTKAAEQWCVAANNDHSGRWRSPRYMPRWASRITLKVSSVRVERLHDITEEDARAEGLALEPLIQPGHAVACFSRLWDEINGKRVPWRDNPLGVGRRLRSGGGLMSRAANRRLRPICRHLCGGRLP